MDQPAKASNMRSAHVAVSNFLEVRTLYGAAGYANVSVVSSNNANINNLFLSSTGSERIFYRQHA